ncbi:MAG TPA: hypothetical protein VF629_14055 [Hymenobacter sp.]|jgi:hypothetical protein|uniref:hypothetical protein n=1 Tax=Hymenobacter sp. TaxID=1898978 RepID=UPI002ED9E57A
MLRPTLLFVLLAGSASAQTLASITPLPESVAATAPAPPAPTQAAPAAIRTAADTVQAIHRLFARRRKAGSIFIVGAVGADLALAGVSSAAESKPQSTGSGGYGWKPGTIHFGFGGFAVIYGVLAAPVMGVGIQQLIAYGPKREAKVVAAYETAGKLPAKIKRQLRGYLR